MPIGSVGTFSVDMEAFEEDSASWDSARESIIEPPVSEIQLTVKGGRVMDDTAYREFFTDAEQTYHRRYEALRAVFVDGRSQKEVAEEFGYTYGSMRQLVLEFRRHCDDDDKPNESFFFEMDGPNVPLPSLRTTSKAPIRR